MAKDKKPKHDWFCRGTGAPVVCENGDVVLNIHTYGNTPLLSFHIYVAYLPVALEEVWYGGRKVSGGGVGWRYAMCAYVGGGWRMVQLAGDDGPIRAGSTAYLTRNDAIKAALHELITSCDEKLLIPSDSSKPYRTHYGLISRPGREQLAYYFCMPEMEPLWQLVDENTKHDQWLDEVRAPKKSALTEQLQLF
jgi:hypothetical protein